MEFTTNFGLHSQATRLMEGVSLAARPVVHGIVTLSDVLFQATSTGQVHREDASRDYNSPLQPTEISSLSCSHFTRRY